MSRTCWPALAVLLACTTPAHADDDAAQNREIMGMMVDAMVQAPTLRKQAKEFTREQLIEALATHGSNGPRAGSQPATPPPEHFPEELKAVYARPDAAAQLKWLPAQDVRPLQEHLPDWMQELDVRGKGKSARLKVEPLEAIFATRIEAQPVAAWWVLQDSRPWGSLTLYNPTEDGPACCRVLTHSDLDKDPPTAFPNLREYLDFEWVAAELTARRRAAGDSR